MDKGTLGAISTVLMFLAFVGICWWAFAPRRKRRFEDDAQLPFADDENDRSRDASAPDAEPDQTRRNDE